VQSGEVAAEFSIRPGRLVRLGPELPEGLSRHPLVDRVWRGQDLARLVEVDERGRPHPGGAGD
jgi:hypothetical protein